MCVKDALANQWRRCISKYTKGVKPRGVPFVITP